MKHLLRNHSTLLIDPELFAQTCDAIDAWAYESELREGFDVFGDPIPQMELTKDGIAIVPVKGVITSQAPSMFEAFGMTDCAGIAENLRFALSNPDVLGIMIDVDSPGGTVGGVMELGDLVSLVAASKPVHAFTSGQMCSAAYWIGAGASAITCTRSADVGSIGVYTSHIDQSKRIEAFGYRVEIFKSGKHKAAGYMGTSLTDDQRAQIQSEVDDIFEQFATHVTNNRAAVSADTMQGQTFMGARAVEAMLVDEMVPDMDAALAGLRAYIEQSK